MNFNLIFLRTLLSLITSLVCMRAHALPAECGAGFDDPYMVVGDHRDSSQKKIYKFKTLEDDILAEVDRNNVDSNKLQCLQNLFDEGMKDEAEYWGNKIEANKADCPSLNDCSDKEFTKSYKFLTNLDADLKRKLKKKLNQQSNEAMSTEQSAALCSRSPSALNPISQTQAALCCGSPGSEGEGVVRAIYPDINYNACLGKSQPTKESLESFGGGGECAKNIVVDLVKQFYENIKGMVTGVWDMGKGAFDLLTDQAARDQLAALVSHPEAVKGMIQQMANQVGKYLEDRVQAMGSCLNSYEQSQFICKMTGQILGHIATLPAGIGKVFQLAKMGGGAIGKGLSAILSKSPRGQQLLSKIEDMNKLRTSPANISKMVSNSKENLKNVVGGLAKNPQLLKSLKKFADSGSEFEAAIKSKFAALKTGLAKRGTQLASKSESSVSSVNEFSKELSKVEQNKFVGTAKNNRFSSAPSETHHSDGDLFEAVKGSDGKWSVDLGQGERNALPSLTRESSAARPIEPSLRLKSESGVNSSVNSVERLPAKAGKPTTAEAKIAFENVKRIEHLIDENKLDHEIGTRSKNINPNPNPNPIKNTNQLVPFEKFFATRDPKMIAQKAKALHQDIETLLQNGSIQQNKALRLHNEIIAEEKAAASSLNSSSVTKGLQKSSEEKGISPSLGEPTPTLPQPLVKPEVEGAAPSPPGLGTGAKLGGEARPVNKTKLEPRESDLTAEQKKATEIAPPSKSSSAEPEVMKSKYEAERSSLDMSERSASTIGKGLTENQRARIDQINSSLEKKTSVELDYVVLRDMAILKARFDKMKSYVGQNGAGIHPEELKRAEAFYKNYDRLEKDYLKRTSVKQSSLAASKNRLFTPSKMSSRDHEMIRPAFEAESMGGRAVVSGWRNPHNLPSGVGPFEAWKLRLFREANGLETRLFSDEDITRVQYEPIYNSTDLSKLRDGNLTKKLFDKAEISYYDLKEVNTLSLYDPKPMSQDAKIFLTRTKAGFKKIMDDPNFSKLHESEQARLRDLQAVINFHLENRVGLKWQMNSQPYEYHFMYEKP